MKKRRKETKTYRKSRNSKCLLGIRATTFVAVLVLAVLPAIARGTEVVTISQTLGEFSSDYHGSGTYYDDYLVGTFNYDLMSQIIVSANISGQWGNSASGSTAHNELWVNGIQIADTHNYSPNPYQTPVVPWSYDFDAAEFPVLSGGSAEFHTIQTSEYIVRLGETTLTIETIPEPGTILLLGLGGLALLRKRR